ncbi:SCO3374 family protein [Streptomyces sp. NBC_01007]|nr:SCO3374 family protein [Streptomyces sp. NBC_01007]
MVPTVPVPRRPFDPGDPVDPVHQWYENELGWAAVPGSPVRLVTGLRFDVLEVPAEAGFAALRHLGPASPVALQGERMRLLVAAGSAEELPGLLDWLEWGSLALDLTAIGAGGSIDAPPPPDLSVSVAPERGTAEPAQDCGAVSAAPDFGAPATPDPRAPLPAGREDRPGARPEDHPQARPVDRLPAGPKTQRGPRGAARWLRPPEPGREVEPALPTLSALGGGGVGGGVGGAPDLVRLVQTMATQCHRVWLRRTCAQPLAFSYSSRMVAGTRPRSLTS